VPASGAAAAKIHGGVEDGDEWCGGDVEATEEREESTRARDPVVVESKDEPYNADGAAFSTSEHGPLPLSRETTRPPPPSLNRVLSAKSTTKRRAEETRCTCPTYNGSS